MRPVGQRVEVLCLHESAFTLRVPVRSSEVHGTRTDKDSSTKSATCQYWLFAVFLGGDVPILVVCSYLLILEGEMGQNEMHVGGVQRQRPELEIAI